MNFVTTKPPLGKAATELGLTPDGITTQPTHSADPLAAFRWKTSTESRPAWLIA